MSALKTNKDKHTEDLNKLKKRFKEIKYRTGKVTINEVDTLMSEALASCWPHDECMKFIDEVLEFRIIFKYGDDCGFDSEKNDVS